MGGARRAATAERGKTYFTGPTDWRPMSRQGRNHVGAGKSWLRGHEHKCDGVGCARFGRWLRCSSLTAPLRGMLPPRASQPAKLGATGWAAGLFRPDFVARSLPIHSGMRASLAPARPSYSQPGPFHASTLPVKIPSDEPYSVPHLGRSRRSRGRADFRSGLNQNLEGLAEVGRVNQRLKLPEARGAPLAKR